MGMDRLGNCSRSTNPFTDLINNRIEKRKGDTIVSLSLFYDRYFFKRHI